MIKISSGKVRDIYEFFSASDELCFVASDRVSAFDSVIPGLEIEGKGKILTEIARAWADWIDYVDGQFETSYIYFDDEQEEEIKNAGLDYRRCQSQLRLDMIPIEAVVRNYLTGSLWEAYKNGAREFCGLELPDGLKESDRLPRPLFTPTTKAPAGQHDENLTFDEMVEVIEESKIYKKSEFISARGLAEVIREWSIDLFIKASAYASEHGIIIADTKFELGIDSHGKLMFGDEILTPDSTRFWSVADYEAGRPQKSLDKQIIRDYIKAERTAGREIIELPPEIIQRTREAYVHILDTLFPDGE